MNFVFISTKTFEDWCWTTPDVQGIGGSETSHIEMSERLAKRGHNVWSYAPIHSSGPMRSPAHVRWNNSEWWLNDSESKLELYKDSSTVYVVYRNPEVIDRIPQGATIWFVCQDIGYNDLTDERALRCTRIIALCETHANFLRRRNPVAADRVCVSSNGIKAEMIRETLNDPPVRNPKRLMYASSPDRGLLYLIDIFERAREIVPDLELHVFYGFNNIDKVVENRGENTPISETRDKILKRMGEVAGIVHHGRVGQRELMREWAMSGIWCHPSQFPETSCITCMDAQALGAIPITNPIWACAENVKYGVFIDGNPATEDLTKARYVLELVRLASDSERQREIRARMMPWALTMFDWECFVSQWEMWAKDDASRLESTTNPQGMNAYYRAIDAAKSALLKAWGGSGLATVEIDGDQQRTDLDPMLSFSGITYPIPPGTRVEFKINGDLVESGSVSPAAKRYVVPDGTYTVEGGTYSATYRAPELDEVLL